MEWTRRSFIKLSCVAFGSLGTMGLIGCSSGQSSKNDSSSNAFNNTVEPAVKDANTHQDTTEQNSGAASTMTAVVYFSATGNTRAVAEEIAAYTDGTLMEIIPKEPYTEADLEYNTSGTRANTEQNDASARPELADPIPDLYRYQVVYLGYPIWWDQAPKIVDTFLEGAVDLSNTIIIPFCTSGSDGIANSQAELEKIVPDADWLEGMRFAPGASKEEVDSWVEGMQAQIND